MHYVYHPFHEPIVVSPEEYPIYLADGWYDSPAKFPAKMAEKEEIVNEALPMNEAVEAPKKKMGRPPKVKTEGSEHVSLF